MADRKDIDEAALLKAIIRRHAAYGRCSQQDLADDLAVSKAGVRYQLHRLVEQDVIINERDKIRPRMHSSDGFTEGLIQLFIQADATDSKIVAMVVSDGTDSGGIR